MRHIFKAMFFILITAPLVIRPALSYADWHHDSGHHDGGHHDGGWHGHDHSYIGVGFSVYPDSYYYGAPYYPYYPPDGVLVAAPVEEPVVEQPTAGPVITMAGAPGDNSPDAITINIPNNKGGYTAVTLKKSGNGYIGPQGEFYPEFPTVVKLKVIYGNQ